MKLYLFIKKLSRILCFDFKENLNTYAPEFNQWCCYSYC